MGTFLNETLHEVVPPYELAFYPQYETTNYLSYPRRPQSDLLRSGWF